MLWKSGYPYEYKDDWEKFNEILLPEEEGFYNHLKMENITDVGYTYAKRVCKDFREYHDLYVQSDTLLLADVFENSR